MRILWLDDDPIQCLSYTDALSFDGHDVEIVASFDEFEGKIKSGGFHLVLIDIMMPPVLQFQDNPVDGIDTGLFVAQHIRQAYPDVKILLLTSREDTGWISDKHGFTVLRKMDVSPSDLNRIVEAE